MRCTGTGTFANSACEGTVEVNVSWCRSTTPHGKRFSEHGKSSSSVSLMALVVGVDISQAGVLKARQGWVVSVFPPRLARIETRGLYKYGRTNRLAENFFDHFFD